MISIAITSIYFIGCLGTRRLIIDNNIPSANPQPGSPDNNPNISPAWALIWPVFWLKTLPTFIKQRREEKRAKTNSYIKSKNLQPATTEEAGCEKDHPEAPTLLDKVGGFCMKALPFVLLLYMISVIVLMRVMNNSSIIY